MEEMAAARVTRKVRSLLTANFCLMCAAAAAQVSQSGTYAAPAVPTPSSIQMQMQQAQDPFAGGRVTEKATPGVLQLTLLDAIERGLRNNLGLLVSGYGIEAARAARLKVLADLLPNLTTLTRESSQQVNLAAFGIPAGSGFPAIVGPFHIFDARAFLSESLALKSLRGYRAGQENERAAQLTYANARELVVLVVGGLYLQTLAGASRVDTAQAQLNTATAVSSQAVDMRRAGTVAGIDVLRAQVEMQAEQQRVLYTKNEFEKQKLQLARAIGLPEAQQFVLSEKLPYQPAPPVTLEQALGRAYSSRADYRSALSRLNAAQLAKSAAQSERLPSLELNGDYGDIGTSEFRSHGTYTASAGIRIPIFQGGKVQADVAQANALLQQRQAEADDLKSRIEFEVRSALLDLQSAADQVQVAQQAVGLSHEALQQARDRFGAGVTNNIEVIQAQQAVATAEENYITSLNAHNMAKLLLARALGVGEQQVRAYLKGTQ